MDVIKHIWLKIFWFSRPYEYQIRIKEVVLDNNFREILFWLKKNVRRGWKAVGYVQPHDDEIETRVMQLGNGPMRVQLPHAFVGFEFKHAADAVHFKFFVSDL